MISRNHWKRIRMRPSGILGRGWYHRTTHQHPIVTDYRVIKVKFLKYDRKLRVNGNFE